MDLSLKQRLLGAAVLIALAVIVVPMIMSGSAPKKSAEMETSSLAIPPAPDREFQQRVLPVDAAAQRPTAPAPSGDTITTVDTANAPAAAPTPAPVATTAPLANATTTESVPKPAPSTPSKSTPAPVDATLEPVKPTPGQAANGRFLVHLGVYAATKNADDLVAILKKDGFPAFAEASEYQGKHGERVRVGPFEDRAAAEAARLRIQKLKPTVPGSIVQLAVDAKTDAPVTALPANRAGGWAVQLGALKTVEDANKLRNRLKNAGFAAFVDKLDANGSTLWRVRAGPEVDRGAADKLRAGIKEKLRLDGIIVTL